MPEKPPVRRPEMLQAREGFRDKIQKLARIPKRIKTCIRNTLGLKNPESSSREILWQHGDFSARFRSIQNPGMYSFEFFDMGFSSEPVFTGTLTIEGQDEPPPEVLAAHLLAFLRYVPNKDEEAHFQDYTPAQYSWAEARAQTVYELFEDHLAQHLVP